MPIGTCHLSEHSLEHGYRAITLENQFLRVTLLPEKGADICSLVYKPRNIDVLWKAPWGLRRLRDRLPGENTEAAWLDHYEGGWQEIFPNGGDACVYRGAPQVFHGEASVLPWNYAIRLRSSSQIEVEFSVQLYRTPFLLRRTVTVREDLPSLLIREVVQNQGEEEMHFMWGHHVAYGAPFLAAGCRLEIPAKTFLAHDGDAVSASRIKPAVSSPWPQVPGKNGRPVDLSLVPDADDRVTEFGYVCDLKEGWYGLVNPVEGFGVGMAWPKEVFRYIWLWQELRGSFGYPWYGRCYVMGVEPFTSIPAAGLTSAIERGTAPSLAAGCSLEVRLAVVFFEATGRVQSISTDGIARVLPKGSLDMG
jgi:hypothetical protein